MSNPLDCRDLSDNSRFRLDALLGSWYLKDAPNMSGHGRSIVNTNTRICAIATLLIVFASGCVGSDEEHDEPSIARVETDDNVTFEFTRIPNGSIIVSEVGPSEIPSKLASLATQDATPLEVYLAIAPDDEAPIALEIHHATVADTEPRDLSLSFRGFTGNSAAADCSLTEDSEWFYDTYDGTGWTEEEYHTDNGVSHKLGAYTQHWITHVCNYSDSGGNAQMHLKITTVGDDITLYDLGYIYEDYRGVVYLLGSSFEAYYSVGYGPGGGQTNVFRHGGMIP